MSLSVSKQPVAYLDPNVLPGSKETVSQSNDEGALLWLIWVQKLLSANALGLYVCDHSEAKMRVIKVAEWPRNDALSPWAKSLALRTAKTVTLVQATDKEDPARSAFCIPHVSTAEDKRVRHVLVVERNEQARLDRQTQTRLMSWAFASLAFYKDASTDSINHHEVQKTPGCLEEHGHLPATSSSFAQCAVQLAHLADADQCVIVRLPVKRQRIAGGDLLAVSGQPCVDKRLSASRRLVKVVDAEFSGQTLPYHAGADDVTLACVFQITEDKRARLMLPVLLADQWYVVSLERRADNPFTVAQQSMLQATSRSLLGAVLLADPATLGVHAAIIRRAYRMRLKLVQHVPRYAFMAIAGIGFLVFALYPVEHRVGAPLNVEAAEQHVLIAPVDGFVQSVAASAGDQVSEGQILATLDDQDLQLEWKKLQSEVLQNQQAYSRMLAAHDRVEVTRLKEEGALIETELSRLNLQREKMVLKAPVDGIVLSGSWDDFLGAAVSSGDVLFSLGSENSHRLVLDVSEYDVSYIKPEQAVALRLAAEPSTVLSAHVTAIMPLAVAKAGVNVVQVHATLEQEGRLRPGMQGIGKILVGHKSRFMRWFERICARAIWLGWKLGVLQ